jgi:hypothetical protein
VWEGRGQGRGTTLGSPRQAAAGWLTYSSGLAGVSGVPSTVEPWLRVRVPPRGTSRQSPGNLRHRSCAWWDSQKRRSLPTASVNWSSPFQRPQLLRAPTFSEPLSERVALRASTRLSRPCRPVSAAVWHSVPRNAATARGAPLAAASVAAAKDDRLLTASIPAARAASRAATTRGPRMRGLCSGLMHQV